jgi:Uma2 family endonuclease
MLTAPQPVAQVAPTPRRFTVDEYMAMGRAGILHAEERVELIDGRVVEMSPIGDAHSECVRCTTRVFVQLLGANGVVSPQLPIRIGDQSAPQPDIAILRPGSYRDRTPTPEDVLLLIEIADTSLAHDRAVKAPLYAAAGVAEYWILDLTTSTLAVYREPAADGYRSLRTLGADGAVAPLALGADVRVADLLG